MTDNEQKKPDTTPETHPQAPPEEESSKITPADSPETPRAEDPQTTEAGEEESGSPASAIPGPPESEAPSLGRFNACFNGLAKIGPLALLLALACMSWPMFWQPGPGVYCPPEINALTAFLHCVATGSWFAPTGLENGAWTLAQWPAFTWAISLMAWSPSLVQSGYLLPTTTFLCTFFALMGVWCLAHAARFGYRAAFAASLILLCTPIFAPLPRFVGPATLAAGFFLFALVFFCRGWRSNTSWISLPLAFALTAFAGMAGGLLHFIVPLVASFCYLIWTGRLRRAQKADAICGFILMLVILGCWLGAVMLDHQGDAYLSMLFAESWEWGWPVPLFWFLPIFAGILATMPWLLMIFGVSWFRVIAHSGRTLAASRHDNGSALIWISLVLALPVALFVPLFHPSAVAIACLVTILLGKAATNLSSAGSRFFYLLASLALIIAGCLLICLSFETTQQMVLGLIPHPDIPDLGGKLLSLSMLPVIGGIVCAGGLISLMFVKRFSGCGPLIYAILLVIILCQPARLRLLPELAAMPGTPLLTFAEAENLVTQAMAAPAAPEKTPAAPETPAYTIPMLPAEPGQPEQAPAAPAVPESSQPEPAAPEAPGQPEAAQPAPAEPVVPEIIVVEPLPETQLTPQEGPASPAPADPAAPSRGEAPAHPEVAPPAEPVAPEAPAAETPPPAEPAAPDSAQ